MVTPLAGVWIEMLCKFNEEMEAKVTPLAGVWIEIASTASTILDALSHSPCGSVD